MIGKELFKIWAPDGKKWVDWVRPVPFVGIREERTGHIFSNLIVPVIHIPEELQEKTAFIIDLPGVESVTTGIALAKVGFRPIPIYNGTMEQQGARATVDNEAISEALIWGARELQQISLRVDALPAFLTDSNRMNQFKMNPGIFDNSWDVYPQDLPSAEYFVDNGIDQIVIIGDKVARDLKKILYKFQKKNIRIFLMKEYGEPKKITLHRPLQMDID